MALQIKHDGTYDSGGNLRKGVAPSDDPMLSPGALHPIIIKHPVTKELSLYLGRRRNAFIPGLSESVPRARALSEELLDEIWSYATAPDVVVRHKWQVNDIALWNNFTTMHRRDSFPSEQFRVLYRSQIKSSCSPAQTWGD
jgi:taurine dioxygenase